MHTEDDLSNQLKNQQLVSFAILKVVSVAGAIACFFVASYFFGVFFILGILTGSLSFVMLRKELVSLAKTLALADFICTLVVAFWALAGLMFQPRYASYGDILVVTIALGFRLCLEFIYTRTVFAA